MLMFREIPKDNRRLIVANAVFKKNGQLDVICIGIAAKFEIINGVNYYRIPLTYTGAESKFILLYKYLRYIISGARYSGVPTKVFVISSSRNKNFFHYFRLLK